MCEASSKIVLGWKLFFGAQSIHSYVCLGISFSFVIYLSAFLQVRNKGPLVVWDFFEPI